MKCGVLQKARSGALFPKWDGRGNLGILRPVKYNRKDIGADCAPGSGVSRRCPTEGPAKPDIRT